MNTNSDSNVALERPASNTANATRFGEIAAAAWDSMRDAGVNAGRSIAGVTDGGSLVLSNPFATQDHSKPGKDMQNNVRSDSHQGDTNEFQNSQRPDKFAVKPEPKPEPTKNPDVKLEESVVKEVTKMLADGHFDSAEIKHLRNLLSTECIDTKPSQPGKPKPDLHGLK
ncbi:hypothetical protein BH10CYA1_BH10CYA1_36260 [soil metagenome]